MSGTGLDLDELLTGPIADAELRNVAIGIFEYAKVLLDEEDNLTRIGNLNGVAKDKLRARALELLGASEPGAGGDDDATEIDVLAEGADDAATDAGEGEGQP